MKITKQNILRISAVGLLLGTLSAPAGVIHRYSFNETSGTTVADSVGGKNGVLAGGLDAGLANAAYFDGAGQVILPGGGASADPAATISGYVDLPNHLINVLTNMTIETWVTMYAGPDWNRIMDFGVDNTGLEGTSLGGGNYVFISSPGPDNLRFAVREPVNGAELTQCTSSSPLPLNTEVCVTATYDWLANVSRLYVNGALVASDDAPTALSAINDLNNWLGRAQWNDPMFSGSYNEFRIYNNALDSVSVAASYFNGVATPSTDTASLGGIQSVLLTATPVIITVQDTLPTVATADFGTIAGIDLAGVPGVTYQSSNPSVLAVSTNGLITGVGSGVASVTLSYLGKTSAVQFTVNPRLQGVVVAGSLEVDLRATDLATSTATWTNRAAAGSTFTAEGAVAPVYNPNVASGIAGVTFDRANDYVGPASSANITANSDFSIEAWAFVTSPKAENTLVAWGNRGTGGADVALGSGNHPVYGAASFWGGGYDLGWNGPAPVTGQWHYYTLTYNGGLVSKVYADGKLKRQLTVPAALSSLTGLPIRIGAQNLDTLGTVDYGQAMLGSIAMARVHTGLLSDNDVANNYLYGVELTSPGTLQSVQLTFAQTNLPGARYKTYASVRPIYANRNYLVVNGFSTFSSSNTNVATVDVNGYVTAVAAGSAQIIATYAGLSATNTITVTAPPATALVHRYSFNETGGTNVADSVGTAHGVLAGNGATLDAGQVNLPGGTGSNVDPSTIAGYVDLPNYLNSPLVNVTYETWATWTGSGNWQRIFDFGTSNGGEDRSWNEGGYLFLNAQPWRFAVRDIPSNGEPVQINNGAAMPTLSEIHMAVTYNFTENTSRLYTNGVLAVSAGASVQLNTINDVNNWLGRSQWGDPMYQGSINEFRIYEGALTASQVAATFAAGPNALPVLTPPSLTVAASGGNVVISWPTNGTAGYVLQSVGTLAPATTWTNVTAAPVISGPNYQVTQPATGGQQYFKLTK